MRVDKWEFDRFGGRITPVRKTAILLPTLSEAHWAVDVTAEVYVCFSQLSDPGF